MVCDSPPAAVCNGSTLAAYDPQGVCTGGLCVYTPANVSCGQAGCVAGACATDPCQSVTCDAPPSACFAATGTCSAATGTCAYDYADGATCDDGNACTTSDQCTTGVCQGTPKACVSPPASSCTDANTAKVYENLGACSPGTGACSYTYHFVTCVNGCSGGTCNGSGWHAMTSNSNSDLYAVWGSSASDVWAVGHGGTALHYDGTRWSAKSSGTAYDITSIRGTSASNIFAITGGYSGGDLLHYDGTSWTTVKSDLGFDTDVRLGVAAVGPDEAFVSGSVNYEDNDMLVHYKDGAVSASAQSTGTGWFFIDEGSPSLWAFSGSDVWSAGGNVYTWDGTTTGALQATGTYGAVAIWASSEQDVFASTSANVNHWDGTQWTLLNTGLTGTITGLWGTSGARLFASAIGSTQGYVLSYDGSGWVQESIPTSTGLNAIWAAPTGEVFAVGYQGTIVEGP